MVSGCQGRKNIGDGDGNVELTYYVWGNNTEVNAIQQVIDEFEEVNPTIKVNIERAGDNYFFDLKMYLRMHHSRQEVACQPTVVESVVYVAQHVLE